jgi:hypothetical protein
VDTAGPDTEVVVDTAAVADTGAEPDIVAVADIGVVADTVAEVDIVAAADTEAGPVVEAGAEVAEAEPDTAVVADTEAGPAVETGAVVVEAEPDIGPESAFAGGLQPGETVPKDTHLRLSADRGKGWEEPLREGAQVPAHISLRIALHRQKLRQYLDAPAGKGLAVSQ